MTSLELAKEQGNQAAPNVIDAAKDSEVQIDVTLAQEQGNQAAPLIADSLASSESYDAIKQQGNQAMPLIVDALAGGGSDTGFELLDYIDQGSTPDEQIHVPFYSMYESGLYNLIYHGILHNGYNLPNFTKLSVDNADYDIYPMPEQEPTSAGCYLMIQQMLIDRQERADEIKAVTGADVKIGDTLVAMQFALITEQVLFVDVPFTLYADQDSWSGTLHAYVDTSADVYANIEPNSNSTAYEISVYTDNASNPQYKVNDGEWTPYNADNKPEIYQPGNYTLYLKAESNYDSSEVSDTTQIQIIDNFDAPEVHTVEDPSAMFAGLDFRVHLTSNYGSADLTGRDDVVLLYKEQSAADWSSAAMTSTSDGYFAEVEVGWGHKAIEYKVQIDGVSSDVPNYHEFDALPMSPSFDGYVLEDSNGNIGPFVKLHFGANYPDMNTVETIEYSFDDGVTWYDAVHDATLGCELAKVIYGEKTQYGYIPLKSACSARTKLISDNTIKSQMADTYLNKITLLVRRNSEGAGKININNVETLLASETEAYIDVLRPCDFKAEVIPDAGFVFERCYIWEDGSMSQQSTNNPSILHIPDDAPATVIFDAIIQQQSSTDRE